MTELVRAAVLHEHGGSPLVEEHEGAIGDGDAVVQVSAVPLTPLDLEAVRNELKTRPTEERDVMVVCLGWQHDARAWVETYNRNRPVNKLHVVELRTDCDQDAVWLKVAVGGHDATCHTGRRSCFYRTVTADGGAAKLAVTDDRIQFDPANVYRPK